jgi:hypothetical protein
MSRLTDSERKRRLLRDLLAAKNNDSGRPSMPSMFHTTPPIRQAADLATPELERELEDRFLELLTELNPLRRIIPWHFDTTSTTGHGGRDPADSHWPARPFWKFRAPSTLPTPFWMPVDGTVPTPPAFPAFADVTAPAYELVAAMRFTFEHADDARLLFQSESLRPPTQVARAGAVGLYPLALAVAREEMRSMIVGAGTNTDPILGLANATVIPSIAAGASLVDTYVQGIASVRAAGFEPIAILVAPSTEQALRTAKDSAGLYLFPPSQPLSVSNVPVVTLWSIPAGPNTFSIILGPGVVPFVRPIGAGRPLEVRVQPAEILANQDVITIRVRERVGLAALPGIAAQSSRRITGVP